VIALAGLDAPLAGALRARYGPYVRDVEPGPDALRVTVGRDERDYYLDPPERAEFNPLFLACDGDRVRVTSYRAAGWLDTPPGPARGVLLLARGGYEPESHAVENYVRVAVAWRAATRGGALVHGASAIRHGRGYLFFGESGAGKSTLSAHAGPSATVVSDDLSLVLPGPNGPQLVGSPFRGTFEEGEPVTGSVPLAAAFRIVKAERAEVRTLPRAVLMAGLVGNLPFVAEALGARPDLWEGIEEAFATVPLASLQFRKDDSYWAAIEAAGL